jgi:hypothetical protein
MKLLYDELILGNFLLLQQQNLYLMDYHLEYNLFGLRQNQYILAFFYLNQGGN